MKVMIVDDAAFMRMMIRKHLEEAGHEVVTEAFEYHSAMDEFKKLLKTGALPDAITMDITLPADDRG